MARTVVLSRQTRQAAAESFHAQVLAHFSALESQCEESSASECAQLAARCHSEVHHLEDHFQAGYLEASQASVGEASTACDSMLDLVQLGQSIWPWELCSQAAAYRSFGQLGQLHSPCD